MLKFLFFPVAIYTLYHIVTIIVTLLLNYRRGRQLPKDFALDEYKINSFDDDMLYKRNSPYIEIFPFILRTIFWKYYIENYGPVWRWSKLHKEIEEKFKELRDEY